MSSQWKVGHKALLGSLLVYHAWGTVLVVAVYNGREGLTVQGMFDALCAGITWGLAILIAGKGWDKFAPLKWGAGAPAAETEKK